ncbi:MAG: pyruvate kinase [Methylocystaceae bacterium]
MRKTKIICTIGPASESPEMIGQLIEAGMNVARLNFSHSTREEHAGRIATIRQVARDMGVFIGIMLDTKGPEIRTGKLKASPIDLVAGQQFILTSRDVIGTSEIVSINYPGLPAEVNPKDRILLADGLIELEVNRVEGEDIICQVVTANPLGEKKGVNVPGVALQLPFLSKQDREDICFGLAQGIDFVAASFVQGPQDILAIRRLMEEQGRTVDIIAKIESREALQNLEEIIKVADGVMVARGDLGVEIPTEQVPIMQKRIMEECHRLGRPVIIATQMLESMVNNPRPTRAEASDVANAVLGGADAIMLSAESAAGKHPIEAVKTMARIASYAETEVNYEELLRQKRFAGTLSVPDAIAYASCTTAMDLKAAAILTATHTGSTAQMVAKYRPLSPIIASTPFEGVARSLALTWGVYPVLVSSAPNTDEMVEGSTNAAWKAGYVQGGDMVVFTAGIPSGQRGSTNFLKVHIVGEVLVKGTGIGKRVVAGRVKHWSPGVDLVVGKSDILVLAATDAEAVPYIAQAAAVIAEEGGLTCQTAVAGLSLGIPVIVGAKNATGLLTENMEVTADCARGQVYRGGH